MELECFKKIKESTEILCAESLTGKFKDYVFLNGDFDECVKVEKIGQPIADDFYKNCMGAANIKRYDYNDPKGKLFQINDVDCTITINDPFTNSFHEVNISEKFRQIDTNDMCIELWSDFVKKKPGWAIEKDLSIQPDFYLYVTPQYIYKVPNGVRFREMILDITSELDWSMINQFMREEDFKKKKSIECGGSYSIKVGGHDATLIRVWTRRNMNAWYGVSICIPWITLFNDYFIDINIYDRKYNKININ